MILADDHTLLLDAFRKLLVDDCEVVAAVSDGRALLEATATLRPDVVVVDIAMPLLNGIDAAPNQADAPRHPDHLPDDERGSGPGG